MKKPPERRPRGFVKNAYYERIVEIMRTDPKLFFHFLPSTKYKVSIYLDLKERAESRDCNLKRRPAIVAED